MLIRSTLTATLLCATTAAWGQNGADAARNNWHQWRGPLASGVAPTGSPPIQFDAETNVKWKVAIPGKGSASPIIWGDRIYVVSAVETDRTADNADQSVAAPLVGLQPAAFAQRQDDSQPDGGRRRGEGRGFGPPGGGRRGFGRGGGGAPTNDVRFVVMCLDRQTGETVWERTACEVVPHEGHHDTNSYASASPITDGKRLFAYFGSRGLYCYDMDGKLQWDRDFGDMQTRHGFGEGATPVLHDDTLVVPWDHEGESFIVAVNATTGEEIWRQPRDEPTTWVTPMAVEHDGRTQVVTNGTVRSRSYDLQTGELIWECGGQVTNPIPSPLIHDGLAICMTGYKGYALRAISLGAEGDVTGTDAIVWSRDSSTPYIASPIIVDGRLYFTKSSNAILTCVDAATGEVLFEEKRLPELDTLYASPVAADGRIYFCARSGNVCVIKAGPELEVLATNSLGETIDASPAIVGDEMFIRGEQHLFCIAEN